MRAKVALMLAIIVAVMPQTMMNREIQSIYESMRANMQVKLNSERIQF